MAGILTNPDIVPAPPPQPLRYGLFTAATVTDDLDARGIGSGFQIATPDCGIARLYDANCATNPEKTFDQGTPYLPATPYWVYATRQCGPVGQTPQEFADSVRRRLLSGEQHEVEAGFWGGTAVAVDPNLNGNVGTTIVTPSAPGAGAAISALEEAFYDASGHIGTIHINQRAYGALAYSQILYNVGRGTMTTGLGSLWSLGSGYGITGPAGVAPAAGFVWAFMTSHVWIRRSQVIQRSDPRDMLDRTLNQYKGLAERVYAHTWTCPDVFAVQVPIAAPAVATVPAVP